MIKDSNDIEDLELKLAKENQEQLERVQFLTHEAFVVNPFGKELLEYWKKQYVYPIIGPNSPHLEYITAAGDFVKQILGMCEEHKVKLHQGDKL